MAEDLELRRQIASAILGESLDAEGIAPCPGRDLHSKRSGHRDFRVQLTGAPTGFCFHSSCAAAVEEFNLDLRRAIGRAESGDRSDKVKNPLGIGVAAKPKTVALSKRPPFEPDRLADLASRCARPVTLGWLRERSPLPVPPPESQGRDTAAAFLSALYQESERVLVFTAQWSQGDFLYVVGKGAYRLGDSPRVRAVPSLLPEGGPEGVWYLNQPVTGQWMPNLYAPRGGGPQPPGRRHGGCVTAWRYMVLESDVAHPEQWLRAVVQFPLPIAAIYTSGGRSIHALIRVDARSKAEWDSLRDDLRPTLCTLGADPGAMTAVRLTRLPGMLRHGARGKDGKIARHSTPRLQELVWLNPAAPVLPILQLVH